MTDLLSARTSCRAARIQPAAYLLQSGLRREDAALPFADLVGKRPSATAGCTDAISMSQPQLSHALDSCGDANT
jgi:hypothetical protein